MSVVESERSERIEESVSATLELHVVKEEIVFDMEGPSVTG